jgi:hypothetical protein
MIKIAVALQAVITKLLSLQLRLYLYIRVCVINSLYLPNYSDPVRLFLAVTAELVKTVMLLSHESRSTRSYITVLLGFILNKARVTVSLCSNLSRVF